MLATDKDSGANGLVEYSIVPGSQFDPDYANSGRLNTADGYGFFAINLPHQGQVTVNRTLDYEKTQRYYVTIVATVSFTFYDTHQVTATRIYYYATKINIS